MRKMQKLRVCLHDFSRRLGKLFHFQLLTTMSVLNLSVNVIFEKKCTHSYKKRKAVKFIFKESLIHESKCWTQACRKQIRATRQLSPVGQHAMPFLLTTPFSGCSI